MPLRPHLLLDTGPLVAYFNPRDPYHEWACNLLDPIEAPLITCEVVLAEAFHLVARFHNGIDLITAYCASGILQIDLRILQQIGEITDLLHKYRNIPMDLADACLVHLADQHRGAAVITTDRDFLLYRTKSRRQIPLIAPFLPPDN